jgi:hypothetical protein
MVVYDFDFVMVIECLVLDWIELNCTNKNTIRDGMKASSEKRLKKCNSFQTKKW